MRIVRQIVLGLRNLEASDYAFIVVAVCSYWLIIWG
jgi:hypothetical protein